MISVVDAPSSILSFWDKLLPAQNSEHACLQVWEKGKFHRVSFKDIHAQAHCAAGYLMRKGLRKGDHVGLVSGPGLRYHVIQLALQFVGAVNVTLPSSFKSDEVELLARHHDFKMLFVDSAQAFLDFGEFPDLKEQLLMVLIGEDDVDALQPEKIVTYDRVVTLGKAAWREDIAEIKAQKASMGAKDVMALLLDAEGNTNALRMEDWMAAVAQAAKVIQNSGGGNFYSLLSPDRLLLRAYGFAAIQNKVLWWMRQATDFSAASVGEIKPSVVLLPSTGLAELYTQLPGLLENPEKSTKAIAAALAVVAKRQQAMAEKKKDAFFNRIKYKTRNKKLYAKIKAKLGGHLAAIVLDQGPLEPNSKLLLEECGFNILQD